MRYFPATLPEVVPYPSTKYVSAAFLFLVAWTPVEHFINLSLLQWFPTVAAVAAKTAALP